MRHLGSSLLLALLACCSPAPSTTDSTTAGNSGNCLHDDQPIYFDADGLIVHRGLDGGDTAQREGWYWLGVWIRQNVLHQPWAEPRTLSFAQVLKLLEPNADGVFYRHPKLAPWNNPHGDEYGFSRDQMTPLVAAMGLWGHHTELRRLWDALPEDALGKHTFNGSWKNLLGQNSGDCPDIKSRSCEVDRDCSLQVDTRDCSLLEDRRDCSLQWDTRDCSTGWGFNDPFCESAKAAQNVAYKAIHDKCELEKAAANVGYKAAHDECEVEKGTQNVIYKAAHDQCEVEKASERALCEADKSAKIAVCDSKIFHTGDLVGPATVNLFHRAFGESTSAVGDGELLANVAIRLVKATDRDDVGDDLNLIVQLLMAKLRSPSGTTDQATRAYAARSPSYGSYFGAFCGVHGVDAAKDPALLSAGIAGGWQTDVSAPYGAIIWYHRADTGANPKLATLYQPIVQFLGN